MKNYSFFFDDDRFDISIVSSEKDTKLYELYFDEKNVYILTPLDDTNLLKIFYPLTHYKLLLQEIKETILFQLILLSFISISISLVFSLYALRPLRVALKLLEEFIKDIIHDLNTPLSSILINLKMMDTNNEEVKSITQSANVISMLHKNLDLYLKDVKFNTERFSLKEVLEENIDFFSSMYDYLAWDTEIQDRVINSDKNAFSRIIYNLLSNASKYNTSNGFIHISLKDDTLYISNDSYGIHDPSKVFNRFYKESERGLGIGLHIVEKLCNELNIEKKFEVNKNIVTSSLNLKDISSSK